MRNSQKYGSNSHSPVIVPEIDTQLRRGKLIDFTL